MAESLKEIILDSQEAELPTGVPRRAQVTPVPGKATVCIGPRRSGKTTLMFQLIRQLQSRGVPRRNILYLNFFDDRLRHLQQQGPGPVLEAYFSLHPDNKSLPRRRTTGRDPHGSDARTLHFFFDEIQTVPGWEPFVERAMRTENCELYLTGSSAQMLSREIATQMRGRALSWELFPFSFREHLDFLGIDGDGPLSARRRLLVEQAFSRFLEAGGFPEVAALAPALRVKTHQEYWGAMLFRDLIERHDVAHPRAVADLAHWLVDNAASLYSVNRLTGYLKSLGHRVPKAAVSSYLEWFEDAFFLFTVRIFDASLARANANPKKIYCIDHALVRSVSSGILVNRGHLLENLVFTALRRVTPDVHYYRSRAGREVDFIARMPDGSLRLVQVCESLADPRTRRREVAALRDAMAELGLASSQIVTRDSDQEPIPTDSGRIQVVAAWRFLLDLGGPDPLQFAAG